MEGGFIIGVSAFNALRLKDAEPKTSLLQLSSNLLDKALSNASPNLCRNDIDGLMSIHPGQHASRLDSSTMDSIIHRSYARWLSTELNLHNPSNKSFITKTCESGGASPISLCIQATDLIHRNNNNCIAILITQIPNNVDKKITFGSKSKINLYFHKQLKELNLLSIKAPAIPKLYGKHTEIFLNTYGNKYNIKRKHLAMVPILMYRNGYSHPQSICYKNNKLLNANVNDILNSKDIGVQNGIIKQYECARVTDGGICILIASKQFIINKKININRCFKIIGSGESTHGLKHNMYLNNNNNNNKLINNYGIYKATRQCLQNCNINNTLKNIHWFGIYDCYPIAFIYGLIASKICTIENISMFLENWYKGDNNIPLINTHGGLLGFGAPICVPAGFSLVEAVNQLRNEIIPQQRQKKFDNIKNLRALIIGNGGIFHTSAVVVIEKCSKNNLSKL